MTTKRKPYVRGMQPSWWTKLGFYRFYITRESTCIPQLWFSLVVLFGVFALKNGPESWAGFVDFLKNPIIFIINIVTFFATIFHAATWFKLAPKAVNIVIKNEKLPQEPVVRGLWAVTIIATVVILAVALIV